MKKAAKKFLKPRQGLRVICPELNTPLPAAGDYRDMTPYWWKRVHEGDIQVFESPENAQKEVSTVSTKTKSKKTN